MKQAHQNAIRIFQNVRKVIYGKDEQIRLALCCWFAGGHLLIEDNPGTGKTILARAIAKSARVDFQRIQFTPDLLPSDVSGTHIYDQKTSEFRFHKGPVLTTVLLADELNRATPRTQSALLEAMGEGQVTVDGQTEKLDELFFTIATQNPIEQHGTFPLPEAQLDRFMLKISLGYPGPAEEVLMLKNQAQAHPIHSLEAVAEDEDLRRIRLAVKHVKVSDAVLAYAVEVVNQTRVHPELRLGASPRSSIALVRCAQALAFFEGIDHVRPSHVFKLLGPVLGHRVALTTEARLASQTPSLVVESVSHLVSVPVA